MIVKIRKHPDSSNPHHLQRISLYLTGAPFCEWH